MSRQGMDYSHTKFQIIMPDGMILEDQFRFDRKPPSYKTLQGLLGPFVEGQIEHVNVFYEGEYRDMFVNETGMRDKLELNPKATEIYLNNTKVHDPDRYKQVKNRSAIYGVAVLFPEEKVWV